MSLKLLIEELQSFAVTNKKVKRFHFDFKEQLDNFSTSTDTFPIVFVTPDFGMNVSNVNGYFGQEITLSIFILDRINTDRTNMLTVLNEMNNIANDIIIFFKNNRNIQVSSDFFTTEPINNYLVDNTAGYNLTVNFIIDSQSDCYYPSGGGGGGECEPSVITIVNTEEDILHIQSLSSGSAYTYEVDNTTFALLLKDKNNIVIGSKNYSLPSATDNTDEIIVDIESTTLTISNSTDTWSEEIATNTVLDDTVVVFYLNDIIQDTVNIPYHENKTINLI